MLGSTPAPAAGGFGQTNTTGAFGQATPAAGGFGAAAAAPAAGGFGGFGAAKPATGATGGFGGFGAAAAPAAGGFGATAGGFGQPAASKPATSFSFGAAAPAPAAGGFGGFGASAAPAAGGFGAAAAPTGGLFGAAKPAAPTTSLFGNTTGATLGGAATTTGGFGGFGATQNQAAGTAGGGLFGQKPAAIGGLGGGGMFGSNTTLGGATTGGFGGGFGQQAAGAGGGSFNLPASGGLTSFGTNPLQQQQPLVATVDKNPYGNNPLFDLSKTTGASGNGAATSGPTAVSLEGNKSKPVNLNYPISPRVVSKIKLRGFSFPTAAAAAGKPRKHTSNLDGISDDAVLGVGAFAPRGAANKKMMVFDSTLDTSNVANLVNNKKNETAKRRVMFDPELEVVASGHNHNASTSAEVSTCTTTTTATVTSTTTTSSTAAAAAPATNSASASTVAIKNGYYISPTLETLAGMSKDSLKAVQNLTVGRKGYGEVKFEGAVDLTDVVLEDIMGNIVVIEDKKIVVYPKEEGKPAKGTKLNVPAVVRIENCYSHDKNTGAAITDPEHPRFKLFKEKLRKRSNVEFVDYDDATGAWTFKAVEF